MMVAGPTKKYNFPDEEINGRKGSNQGGYKKPGQNVIQSADNKFQMLDNANKYPYESDDEGSESREQQIEEKKVKNVTKPTISQQKVAYNYSNSKNDVAHNKDVVAKEEKTFEISETMFPDMTVTPLTAPTNVSKNSIPQDIRDFSNNFF